MKYSGLMMTVLVVGHAGLWAAVQACVSKGDACPGILLCGSDNDKYTSGLGSNCDGSDHEAVVCNFFGCNCKSCQPGCSNCQVALAKKIVFGGALAPAANTTATADPCASFEEFIAMTVPQQMQQLNSVYCADATSSVGFKFLGYVLNLVDTNKDGVITCAEYNSDQASNSGVIKKKPDCRLKAGITLKHAHSKV